MSASTLVNAVATPFDERRVLANHVRKLDQHDERVDAAAAELATWQRTASRGRQVGTALHKLANQMLLEAAGAGAGDAPDEARVWLENANRSGLLLPKDDVLTNDEYNNGVAWSADEQAAARSDVLKALRGVAAVHAQLLANGHVLIATELPVVDDRGFCGCIDAVYVRVAVRTEMHRECRGFLAEIPF